MLTKALIGVSALISAGVIVGVEPATRPAEAPAKFADRFPSFEQLMLQPTELQRVPVLSAGNQAAARPAPAPAAGAAPKGDRQAATRPDGCERQTWPYLGNECLVSLDGTAVRRPARTITIERRFEGGSILVQAEIADMVSR
jgi:hypothetical protein